LRVPDFVLPNSDNPAAWEVNYQPVLKAGLGMYLDTPTTAAAQESLMFRNFARQIRSGVLTEDWPKQALWTQRVVDACFASAQADGRWCPVT
jgi:hypothetical protein